MRGLVTYYTVFVIELHSRRVQVLGSTPNPDEAFVVHTMRHLTDDVDGVLRGDRLLICVRDRKWSAAVECFLATAGVRVIRTPLLAPNLRRTLAEFVAHYHGCGAPKLLLGPPKGNARAEGAKAAVRQTGQKSRRSLHGIRIR